MAYITSEELIGILKQNNAELIATIREECKAATMLLGINVDKPQEMQELMAYMRGLKTKGESIKTRLTDNFVNSIWVLVVFLIIAGFTFYCTKQMPVTLRDEKIKINKIMKVKEKVGGF